MIKKTKYFHIALLYKSILKDIKKLIKDNKSHLEIENLIYIKYNTKVFYFMYIYPSSFFAKGKLTFLDYFDFKKLYILEKLQEKGV